MSLIIPDNILDTLLCSFCHKYLSVKPVKIYPNRRIQCGRCVDKKEPALQKSKGVVESLYGLIAEHVLFKCVNKFDGCRQLLTYSQVLDHEKVCLEKYHQCPICCAEMTSFLMLHHFHFKHKNAVLDCPTLVFNLNDHLEMPSSYIYQEEDNLFFLYISYSKSKNTITLDLVCIGDYKLAKNIYHQFTISSENKDFDIVLDPKSCTTSFVVDISHMSNCIHIKFKLIDHNLRVLIGPPVGNTIKCSGRCTSMQDNKRSKKKNVVRKPVPKNDQHQIGIYPTEFNLKCVKCQECCIFSLSNGIAPSYYHSRLNGYMCYYCYKYFLSTPFNIIIKGFYERAISSEIIDAMNFFKWNCSKCCIDIQLKDIQSHEINCKRGRQFKCPIKNCCEKGTANQMIEHLKVHNCLAFSSNFQLTSNGIQCYVFVKEYIVSLHIGRTENFMSFDIKVVTKADNAGKKGKVTPYFMLFDTNNQRLKVFDINPVFVKVIVI